MANSIGGNKPPQTALEALLYGKGAATNKTSQAFLTAAKERIAAARAKAAGTPEGAQTPSRAAVNPNAGAAAKQSQPHPYGGPWLNSAPLLP